MTSEEIFKNKLPDAEKLKAFGFRETDSCFIYRTRIAQKQFLMTITVTKNGQVSTKVLDPVSDSEYVLHRNEQAVGAFVGMVRADHDRLLLAVAESCFNPDIFKSRQAHEIISYVQSRYNDKPLFLWRKSPQNAVWKRQDTGKWYGVLMVLPKRRLGFDSDDTAEILDLRAADESIEDILADGKYLPGYHMSKKHWFTVCLNGSVPTDEICRRIDSSYNFAVK